MSGGLVNNAEVIAYTVTSAVDTAGLLVAGSTSSRTVDLCIAGTSDSTLACEPIGYTFTNTKIQYGGGVAMGTAQARKVVGIGALIEGQIIELEVADTHGAIAIGDEVMPTAAGQIIKKSGATWVVGRALTALAENTAGFVQVRIRKRFATA